LSLTIQEVEALGWQVFHQDEGDADREPFYQARKLTERGTPAELGFPSVDALLNAITEWENAR
jgi:hypothetical protein